MNIHTGKRNIAIDAYVSTSGRYRCFLAEAYRPDNRFGAGFATLRWFEAVFIRSDGQQFKKNLGGGLKSATEEWERMKALLTAPAKEEEQNDKWEVMTFANKKFTQSEAILLKTHPGDVKMIVRPIVPVDEVTARAEAAGLAVVVDEAHKPRPTMGLILKVGVGLADHYRAGDVVIFNQNSGSELYENGQLYRILADHEVIGKRLQEDGFEDLNLRDDDVKELGLTPKETVQ